MRQPFSFLITAAMLSTISGQAKGETVLFDFADGTSQGWTFDNSGGATWRFGGGSLGFGASGNYYTFAISPAFRVPDPLSFRLSYFISGIGGFCCDEVQINLYEKNSFAAILFSHFSPGFFGQYVELCDAGECAALFEPDALYHLRLVAYDYASNGGGASFRDITLHGVVLQRTLPGDYNGNGLVDAADYTAWRDTLGSTSNLAADGSGNGIVDVADYSLWKNRFGQNSGSAAALAGRPVPEPGISAWAILLGGVTAGIRLGSRSVHRQSPLSTKPAQK